LSPIRLCLEPRCGNKATGRGRCDEHRKQRERERSEARRRKVLTGERTADAVKVYHSQKWLNTRKAVLSRDPICQVCDNELSTQVDHIKPLSQGGDPYALDGLQGICVPCHAVKSGRESAQLARG
jgi:5-methylcytosine-specific restriction endonuclease McrA